MCNDPPSAFTHFCHLRWSIRKRKTQWRGKLTPQKRKKKDNRSCRFPSFIGERDWNNYFEWVNDRILLLLLTPRTHIVSGLSLCCAKQIKQGVRQDKWHRAGMHGSLLNFPLVQHSALNQIPQWEEQIIRENIFTKKSAIFWLPIWNCTLFFNFKALCALFLYTLVDFKKDFKYF